MSKTSKEDLQVQQPDPVPVAQQVPRLGTQIQVKAASGRIVLNNELGGHFSNDVSTSVTVTVRILKLLADADLVRV